MRISLCHRLIKCEMYQNTFDKGWFCSAKTNSTLRTLVISCQYFFFKRQIHNIWSWANFVASCILGYFQSSNRGTARSAVCIGASTSQRRLSHLYAEDVPRRGGGEIYHDIYQYLQVCHCERWVLCLERNVTFKILFSETCYNGKRFRILKGHVQ